MKQILTLTRLFDSDLVKTSKLEIARMSMHSSHRCCDPPLTGLTRAMEALAERTIGFPASEL